MDALIMAGGRGSRLGIDVEKPLLSFRGRPLVEHVLSALEGAAGVERIYAATSPRNSGTTRYLIARGVEVLLTPGSGYVEDLRMALSALGRGPVLVAAADLPLLTPGEVEEVLGEYRRQDAPALSTMVPLSLFRRYGLTPTLTIGELVPAGVNVVDSRNLEGEERIYITENIRLAVNVNRPEDLKKAEEVRRLLNANKQRTP
ncbi:MAG: NTP transferase domain-containing protein [Euryarchaeota archaeon]|nr:NTP transferase domain-containing protein [Euryarchaeota archaeon]